MEAQGLTGTPGHYDRMKEVNEFNESKMGVKGLSDSGITSIPRIFVHSEESLSDMIRNSPPSDPEAISIPVIDLSGMNSPADRPKIVDQVKEAAKTWGFFQVVNHGIPIAAMDGVVSSVEAFHDMSYDVKSRYYNDPAERRSVAYGSNVDLFRSAAASWRDTLRIYAVPEPPPAAEIPEVCRREAAEWIGLAAGAAEKVLELLAEGLGLKRGRFKELGFFGSKLFAGHCYPPCPEPDRTVGLVSHTDRNFMTVLMQNHVPGLQVKYGDSWVDVKPLHGGLIVNIGDLLQIASNDEYTSVLHRVLANSQNQSRISIVMFFGVLKWEDGDRYGPLPELLSPENPAKYRQFTKEDYTTLDSTKAIGVRSIVERFKI